MSDRLAELQQAFDEKDEDRLEELLEADPELYDLVMEEMNALPANKSTESKQPVKSVEVHRREGETDARALARFNCTPESLAAISVSEWTEDAGQPADINALISELESQTEAMRRENARSEGIFASQSHTLNAIFHYLLRLARAHFRMGRISVGGDILKLAFRSQAQCRSTVDSLTAMRRPVMKQTNIAHGHQQVNNFPGTENPPNELLEDTDGERLDTGTPTEAVRGDQTLETVGAKHRAKNEQGQD